MIELFIFSAFYFMTSQIKKIDFETFTFIFFLINSN